MKINQAELDACAERDNIIARCPRCLGIVFVVVNHPMVVDRSVKREIGDMVSDGYLIEHMTREQFRKDAGAFGHNPPCKGLAKLPVAGDAKQKALL